MPGAMGHLPSDVRELLTLMADPREASPEEVYYILEQSERASEATLVEVKRYFGRRNLFV